MTQLRQKMLEELQRRNYSHRTAKKLNCVALRSSLNYEVAWRAVKGQDERQKTAPLTALHATREVTPARCRRKNSQGRHVGLDFYDLLIEALIDRVPGEQTAQTCENA